ncbi:hypothetical protein QE152_g26452 [Popillia japonica]|uniref:Uncharacterized protein n=1 Tax=Popillia japonica TaxID=7064 RepID=A0AAW1JZ57_POPJA
MPRAPWLTENVRLMMSLRDKALKQAKLKKSESAFVHYKELRNYTTSAIRREKRAYLRFISKNSTDSKRLWHNLKLLNVYHKDTGANLPLHFSNVEDLNDHFVNAAPRLAPDSVLLNSYNSSVSVNDRFSFTLASRLKLNRIILS